MNNKNNNYLLRKNEKKSRRKIMLISVEGNTEKQYFGFFKNHGSKLNLKLLCHEKKSAPRYVFQRIENWLQKNKINKRECNKYIQKIWLVIDREKTSHRTDNELSKLYGKCQKKKYNLAVSNPKFEYWLLLHFEPGDKIKNAYDCDKRLKKHMPEYNKNPDKYAHILQPKIEDAILRAKAKDNPPCPDWPRTVGTTVYRLVESFLQPQI